MKGTQKKPIRHNWNEEDYAEYRRKVVRESISKRREKAREEGLCPICCTRLPTIGKKTCDQCRKWIADHAWEKRHGCKRM